MFVHKVLFEFLEFKHPRLLLVSPCSTSTGGGLLGVKFLASKNWCGRVHFGGHSPEWRVLAKFSVQPWTYCSILKAIPGLKIDGWSPLQLTLFSSLVTKNSGYSDYFFYALTIYNSDMYVVSHYVLLENRIERSLLLKHST